MNTGLQQAAAEAANAACSGQLSGAVSNNPVNDFPNKMSSLGEVQRIIGLSLSKIQMGRNQRGGLPLHKNLLVATVLNKARDVYMQETMYMNYRLMACGQFTQEDQEDMEDDDTPDTEDYEEDSESDVEDDNDSSASKDYPKEFVGMGPSCVT